METIIIILSVICTVLLILLIRSQVTKPDGLLNIDIRDPDKDYYDFVFLVPIETIPKKKNLKVEVHVKS